MRLSGAPEADMTALRKHGGAILDQVNALQQFNRRVLEKLRPVGLAELGLRQALEALRRHWRESYPGVAIETRISRSLGETGETADLTIYRVVQEALTNVFRHADATAVDVTIEPAGRPKGERDCALVRVSDNGCGLKPGHKLGLGLTGMRERILALGGSLTVASGECGVMVEALIPRVLAQGEKSSPRESIERRPEV
jgi:two-component system sensor histidine kinase UhpB